MMGVLILLAVGGIEVSEALNSMIIKSGSLRVTNYSVTALISNRGEVLARLPSDEPGVLMETVKLYEGKTPFAGWGHWPLITACLLLLGLGLAERLQISSWVSRWRGP